MSQNARLSEKDAQRRNGANGQGWDEATIRRVLVLVVGVTNPLVWISAVLTVAVGQKRAAWWHVSAAGAVLAGVSALFGGVRGYFAPWREVVAQMKAAGFAGASTLGEFAAARLGDWVLAQAPFGIGAGVLIGGLIMWRRGRFAADWRDEEPELHTMSPREARAVNARVERKKKKMGQWANTADVQRLDDVAVRLGVSKPGCEPVDIPLGALRLHSMIFGPSGFGKTTTILEIIKGLTVAPAAAPFRIGTIFVTMKPEADITESLRKIAQATGRGFHVITQDGHGATGTYNPLKHGTAQMRANVLVGAEANAAHGGFSEPHYQRLGLRSTLVALEALEAAVAAGLSYRAGGALHPWRLDVKHVARMMSPASLESVRDSLGGSPVAVRISEWLEEAGADSSVTSGAAGMRSRFAAVAEGAAGAVLVDEPGGLDLEQAIVAGDIVVLNLDAAQDLEAAQFIANLAISDFVSTIARLGHAGWHIDPATGQQNRLNFLVVDEFAALGATGLIDAVERSRSHGAAVMLSAQSYTGLSVVGEGFLERVSTSTTVKFIHRSEAEAETLAQLIGTRKGWAETQQTFEDLDALGSQFRASGQGSLREVDKFKIHPNVFRNLAPGEVVAVWGVPQLRAEVVSVRKTATPDPEVVEPQEPEKVEAQPEVEAPAVEPVPENKAEGEKPRAGSSDEMWGWN
ncbi:hypothetical protein [Rothia mucilaginosa]|uniref:hypothetical protein n=1 Tax=Rothia mucilaginosa TaxID=43675 RepID=UPI0028D514F6|nr:hypothetical protein [Rothia mucilaginosa]